MKYLKIISGVAGILLLSSSLHAQEEFGFTLVDMDARRAAMAGAVKSLVGDLGRTENPAMMSRSEDKLGVELTYGNWKSSADPNTRMGASAEYRAGNFAVGLSFTDVLYPSYEVIGITGDSEGTFAPSNMKLGLALAYKLPLGFSVGVEAKYLSSSLAASTSYSSFAGSVVVNWHLKTLSVSVGVENVGTTVTSASGSSFSLPSSVLLSCAYSLGSENHKLAADVDFNYYFSNAVAGALGVEYGFKNLAFARLGYNMACSSAPLPSFAAGGLGVKLWGFRLDVAMLFGQENLNGTLIASLAYSF